jgi:hypothetical protein
MLKEGSNLFRVALFLFATTSGLGAVELDGVNMADTEEAAGHHLVLNGFGLRTFSLLRVHIYVAGLYLERHSTEADR